MVFTLKVRLKMKQFTIKKLPYDITSTAVLALVGKYISFMDIPQRMNTAFPVGAGGISNSDIITAYLGLLAQGKNDFEAIEAHRNDNFFLSALGLNKVPSCSTLRQRMDANATNWFELTDQLNTALLGANYGGQPVDFGALPCGYMPLDWDTFVMNNEGTKKESVSRTYQGVDGYTPSAAYLGSNGYCLELALRPGVQHSALETEYNLERVLPMASKLTSSPLLFRADSGLCSQKIMLSIAAHAKALNHEIAFIIKWNRRGAPVESIAAERVSDANTMWCHLREGKRMCLWSQPLQLKGQDGLTVTGRRIMRLTELTIDSKGNVLLFPSYELEGWNTTLPDSFTPIDIIHLYQDHATHEQFHSEFKTDMDLERLPSGKFDTNFLICSLAGVAMNILRLMGQNALNGKDAPVRHTAKRRRIKTVLQELIFKAGRVVQHAGQCILGLSQSERSYQVLENLYRKLSPARKPCPS